MARQSKSTKSKKSAPKTRRARRARGASAKDVQIAYLLDGVRGVEALNPAPARHAVRSALTAMLENGALNTSALSTWADAKFGVPTGHRGRPAPEAGDERRYRAQQLAKGGTFLRLPVEVLGARKGTPLRVAFEGKRIIVEAAA